MLPLIATSNKLLLHSTGVCYRRITPHSNSFLATVASQMSIIFQLFLQDYSRQLFPRHRLVNPGDVVIGHIPCQWFYWKTRIILEFGNRPLLFVSNLVNPNVVDDNGNRQTSNTNVGKIKKMGLSTIGKDWQQSFSAFNNQCA